MVPKLRHRFHQFPEVLFGRQHARIADEHAWQRIQVRPEFVARHANGSFPLPINQPHTLRFPRCRISSAWCFAPKTREAPMLVSV
jgi:hypothetical protein